MRAVRLGLVVGVCLALPIVAARAGAQTPPAAQPAAQQPDGLPAARKALAGPWSLVSLTVHAADGRSAAVEATGSLAADFSDMTIRFNITPAGLQAMASVGIVSPNPIISTTGRVLIDTQSRQISYVGQDFQKKLMEFDEDLAAKRANPFALERIRTYLFLEDGRLRLSTQHDDGKDASVSVWKKVF
jgi:hypothetical protein